ncbi:MAG: GntR family transcriptional regulator [Deltaproteobacteria bacterium]
MPRRILQIDLNQTAPAYEQIANGLRRLLVEGAFRPGDQLPTVRRLAMDLGVHHNTVAEAYRILAAEGWLDLRRGRGATILERPNPRPKPDAQPQFARRLNELVAKAVAAGVPPDAIVEHLESLAVRHQRGVKK